MKILRVLFLSLVLPGCAVSLRYRPTDPPGEVFPVAVTVTWDDRRPTSRQQVGVMSNTGSSIDVSDPEQVLAVVRDAVSDGLTRARVGLAPQASKQLHIALRRMWFAGAYDYSAEVVADATLKDAAGAVLWTGPLRGNATGGSLVSAWDYAPELIEQALANLAVHAFAQFTSEPFQRALAAP